MATGDLVQLAAAKAWLGVTTDDDDALLATLISQISRAIYNSINRSFVLPRNVVESYDGLGGDRLLLRNWPVGAITSVSVDGLEIPPAGPTPSSGFMLEASDDEPPGAMQQLFLWGAYRFCRGRQNIVVAYRAGYEIVGEAQSVPAAAPFTLVALAPYGAFAIDTGVVYASGAALTPVAANPAAGQYAVDPTSGKYTFAAADAGASILLSYGYVPADLSQAALEWVAERYRYKDRIGMASKSLGGQETASYRLDAMPDFVALSLINFRRVLAN
jgi:hypothetical protein